MFLKINSGAFLVVCFVGLIVGFVMSVSVEAFFSANSQSNLEETRQTLEKLHIEEIELRSEISSFRDKSEELKLEIASLDPDFVESRVKKLENEISSLLREVQNNEAIKANLPSRINQAEMEKSLLQNRIDSALSILKGIESQVAFFDKQRSDLQSDLDKLRNEQN